MLFLRFAMNVLLAYTLLDFGFILIFGILAAACLFVNFPKAAEGLENYRKSRRILGMAMGILSLYCIIRFLFPQNHGEFLDFWLLVLFTFYFSWLSYSSFLFLIETPRYTTKGFLIDGIIPLVTFAIVGIVGLVIPKIQIVLCWLLGLLYLSKNVRMFYVCVKEYKTCKREIDNYYDMGPNIKWMRVLLIASLLMSLSAVFAFYIPQKYLFYYTIVPVLYSFLVFKVINFATKKIDRIRHRNLEMDKKPAEEKVAKSKDIAEKLEPMVEKWVADKKFCRDGLNIKDVAAEMGTNQTYLSSYLNNSLEISFQTWLNTLRIEESKILLASKEKLSIEEIGVRVGITQNYNFSRWFKTVTDMTPFQYRRKIMHENR